MSVSSKQIKAYLFYKWYSFLPPNLKNAFKSTLGSTGLQRLVNINRDNQTPSLALATTVLELLNIAYNTQHTSIFSSSSDLLSILRNVTTEATTSLNFPLGDIIYLTFVIRILLGTFSNSSDIRTAVVASDGFSNKDDFVMFIVNYLYRSTVHTKLEMKLLKNVKINDCNLLPSRSHSERSIVIPVQKVGVFSNE